MKFIMLVLIVFCFIYIGYSINRHYKNRNDFFKSFLDFFCVYENEIQFNKNNLINIMQSHSFGKILDNFINNYITSNTKFPNFILENERKEIEKFLDSLGKKDIDGEVQNLKNYKLKFETIYKKSCDDLKKKGSISLKLSFVLGLLLAILLI